ncbi:MAG TPA: hypothetical protein PKC87_03505, partial [Candidatus Absconditabacterales bacterium]|nr:hypothetical protein [Candidatus Absconditabacterales bacterium]
MRIKKLLTIIISMIFLGISYSHAANFDYQRIEQGLGYNEALGVDVDNLGNRYIVGNFYSTSYFGSTMLSSYGMQDAFITKISPTGDYLRAIQGG